MSTKNKLATTPLTTFNSKAQAEKLSHIGAAPEKRWRHASVKGFYILVGKPTADQKGKLESRRWYAVRYQVKNAQGASKDKLKKLGDVTEMVYDDALDEASTALRNARKARESGALLMPTLHEAFEAYIRFKKTKVAKLRQIKQISEGDYRRRFEELVPPSWHHRPLNELTAAAWIDLRTMCVTADMWEERQKAWPDRGVDTEAKAKRLMRPVGETRFDNMMKGVISGVYNHAQAEHPTLVNPVPLMRKKGVLSTPLPRTNHITVAHAKAAWNFMQTEMRAPQRDIAIIGLMTGWRRELICKIPLSRIKQATKSVEWRFTDPGGPYFEKDGKDKFDYPISDLLWSLVFEPRLAKLRDGQTYLIESNRNPGEPYGDIRDSLKNLDSVVGVHVHPQMLRHTFSTWGIAARMLNVTIGQLMMHSKDSTTTGKYQARDFSTMKEGANEYAAWFAVAVGLKAPTVVPVAPAIADMTEEKLAMVQKLAEMPAEALERVLKVASAMQ